MTSAKRLVVKVGTSVLTPPGGAQLSQQRVHDIAKQVGDIHRQGREIIVVTSGAIAAGMRVLGYTARPTQLDQLQAASAIGQWRLMALYEKAFSEQGFHAAQILLTRDDFQDQRRRNVKATLDTLLRAGVIPVINENDSVSTEEIRVGDNDQLAAQVAMLAGAPLLIILTDVDGLRRPGTTVPIAEVTRAELDEVERWAKDTDKATSAGGMRTKVLAARLAMEHEITLVVANGGGGPTLTKIALEGQPLGTVFNPGVS